MILLPKLQCWLELSDQLKNFGDFKSLGQGVYEMRIACGAGYRIYYAQTGQMIYLLLWGGDKSSQSQDIEKAYFLWQKLKTGE